jgi:alpha-glucosidase
VIDTASYLRFERVTSVKQTKRGLLAEVQGELLRIDLVREDLLRVKISRGGVFDEAPTFAECVDPLSDHVDVTFERGDGVVRLRTPALVVSLGLDPAPTRCSPLGWRRGNRARCRRSLLDLRHTE